VHENVISLAKINFMAIFYGLVLPSSQGFDLIRIYMIEKRHPQKRGKVGSSVVLERIIGMITLCIIACVAALVDPALIRGSLMIWVYALSLFVVATLCFILAPISYRLLSSVIYYRTFKLKKLGEIIEYGRKLHESLSLTASIVVFLKSFSLILLFQVATIFNVYLVFLSMGLNVSLSVHLVLMPIVYMISMVPVTVSGIGVREGVFAYLYGRIGVAPPQAVSASLINYAILTLVPAFIALVLAVIPSAPRLQMASVKSSKSLNESE